MLCKVVGVFRLTRDLELRYLADGKAVAKLGLACSEKFKDKETQLFIDATVFGKPAEIINNYAGVKGTQIFLTGKLKTETWEKDGVKNSKISMMIEDFSFIDSKPKGQDTQYNAPQQKHTDYKQPQQKHAPQSSGTLTDYGIDEDLPF